MHNLGKFAEGGRDFDEHAQFTWATADDLLHFDWAEADIPCLPAVTAWLRILQLPP